MKLLKKVLLATFIVLTALVVMPQMQNKVDAAVKISASKKTMYKGYTYKLKITGTNKKVKWSSSNTTKASVNSNGKVYVKKNGKVTITAKVGGNKYKCKVTIKNKPYKLTQFNTTFYDLKDVAKEYRDVERIKNYKDFVFDLDGDGIKDTIRLKNIGKDEYGNSSFVLIFNGKTFFEGQITYAETVYIADLNKNDKTLEVVIRQTGPGDSAEFIVFSKIGNTMKKIDNDNLGTAYCSDYEMKVDQKGKIIINDFVLESVSPKIYRNYYLFNNNKIKTKKLDVTKLKNIRFKTTRNMFFTNNMKNIEKYFNYQQYNGEFNHKNALKNAEIIEGKFNSFKIVGYGDNGEIKVVLKNGTKGFLFVAGGFLAG